MVSLVEFKHLPALMVLGIVHEQHSGHSPLRIDAIKSLKQLGEEQFDTERVIWTLVDGEVETPSVRDSSNDVHLTHSLSSSAVESLSYGIPPTSLEMSSIQSTFINVDDSFGGFHELNEARGSILSLKEASQVVYTMDYISSLLPRVEKLIPEVAPEVFQVHLESELLVEILP